MESARQAFDKSNVVLPDFSRFRGKDLAQVEEELRVMGYTKYPEDKPDIHTFYNDKGDHLVRVSGDADLVDYCTDICMSSRNSYFPVIYAHEKVSPCAHVTVLEPLKVTKDIEQGYTLNGSVRAFSTFITGNNQTAIKDDGKGDHSVVHAMMFAQDKSLVAAAKKLMGFVKAALKIERAQYPIYNDARKNIWFRENKDNNNPPQMIFFESLTLTDGRQAVEQQLEIFAERIEKTLPQKGQELESLKSKIEP